MTELVISLVQRASPDAIASEPDETPRTSMIEHAASRMRLPGSDWLYLKLYHPASLAEELIAGPVRSFTQFACSAALADAWFFIRYADPDPHLRIRFHGEPGTLIGPLWRAVCEWATELVGDGRCMRFTIDTYERELERYGGPDGMRVAEAVFAADSVASAQILALRPQLRTLDRTAVVILTTDDLLAAIGLSEMQRLEWYRHRAPLSREDGKEYRARQAILRRLLGAPDALASEPGGIGVHNALATRRQALNDVSAQLDALERNDRLGQHKLALCDSYVHLHCNRLLGGDSAVEQRALQLLRRTREGLARAPSA